MQLGYRKARSIVLLLAGLLAIALNHTMDGFAVVFGVSLIASSAFTVVYVFLHFDALINQKTVMEMIMDGFAGLVIFTYPEVDPHFLMIVFSFWIVFNGALILTSGLMDEKHKPYLWLYTLTGIVAILIGFTTLNYDAALMGSVLYLVGFSLVLYAAINLYLFYARKMEIY